MKGRLNKLSKGWVVEYVFAGPPFVGELPLLMDEETFPTNRELFVVGCEVSFEIVKQWEVDDFDMEGMVEYAKIVSDEKVEEPYVYKDESILCAAIWYKEIPLKKEIPQVLPNNCDKGLVVLGHRHGQCMWTMSSLTGLRSVTNAEDGVGEYEQGFLTNTNRFVDREEGGQIAFNAGQTKDLRTTLYSEDLY